MEDKLSAQESCGASVQRNTSLSEILKADGVYNVVCHDIHGNIKWSDKFENTVVTVGKNLALDTYLAGSGYTVTGPFMGLIGGATTPTITANDTMASHAGWSECGGTLNPTYSAPRKTCVWAVAASGTKALSAALVFTVSSTGTVAGAFISFGAGAVSTIDSTAGTLYSAGLFTGSSKVVDASDTLAISYSTSL